MAFCPLAVSVLNLGQSDDWSAKVTVPWATLLSLSSVTHFSMMLWIPRPEWSGTGLQLVLKRKCPDTFNISNCYAVLLHQAFSLLGQQSSKPKWTEHTHPHRKTHRYCTTSDDSYRLASGESYKSSRRSCLTLCCQSETILFIPLQYEFKYDETSAHRDRVQRLWSRYFYVMHLIHDPIWPHRQSVRHVLEQFLVWFRHTCV